MISPWPPRGPQSGGFRPWMPEGQKPARTWGGAFYVGSIPYSPEGLPPGSGDMLIAPDERARRGGRASPDCGPRMLRPLPRHYGEVALEGRPSPSPARLALEAY